MDQENQFSGAQTSPHGDVLTVSDLKIDYKSQGRLINAVNGVSFSIREKTILGIVGESGSGKSSVGLAIMRLLPRNGKSSGSIAFEGTDLASIKDKSISKYRGTGMTMIFQEPMTSLNPVMTVGDQLTEALTVKMARRLKYPSSGPYSYAPSKNGDAPSFTNPSSASVFQSRFGFSRHGSASAEEAQARAPQQVLNALRKVRLTDPVRTARKYPHQLSGGERQRVMIAMAYILEPRLLIADEPTTALDVTTQAQVLKLMLELRSDLGTSILFISHDLLVVAQVSDEIAVMYAGDFVEKADTQELFTNPLHPYTKGLMESIPKTYKGEGRLSPIPGSYSGGSENISACKFRARCKFAFPRCSSEEPKLLEKSSGHYVACHLY